MFLGSFALMSLMTLSHCGDSCQPLHLTPLIDAGNITEAQELSEVRDVHQIIPKSYAGFITTDRVHRNHLFFWFFPAINDTETPLVVWLNGGPGISSMLGLLYKNGPIRPVILDNCQTYEKRPGSWAEPFSMLYIDNPVGTGYSYSETNTYKTTQEEYSEELYLFIEQFYLMFPQYLQRELYIGGQSYAGKYVPAFAHRIHTRQLQNLSNIPLTGIYLGGPLFDPQTQFSKGCEYIYAMGGFSHSQLITCQENTTKIFALIDNGGLNNLTLGYVFSQVVPILPNAYPGNYLTGIPPAEQAVWEVMTSDIIRGHVHACNLRYIVDNTSLAEGFVEDIFVSTKLKLVDLLNSYKVLLFTGDFDGIITSPMVEAALLTTPWSLQEQYNNSARLVWSVDRKLKGFYTQTGQFCRVVVHGAGHQIPHDQPESALDMMIQFVNNGCILQN